MYNASMESFGARSLAEIFKDKNIILHGADPATAGGFTQVPNFLLRSRKLSAGDKVTFAMLLSYAWQNDFCFPGQARLAEDMGITDRSVRSHLKALEAANLLVIRRRGQGRTNIYELNLRVKRRVSHADRKFPSGPGRKTASALRRKFSSDVL